MSEIETTLEKSLFTSVQLKEFDGKASRRAYIAFKGKVYDVSGSDLWTEGDHQGMHFAGHDLTKDTQNAPHDEDVVKRFPIVGELRE